jgi:hypothetical protein
MSASWVCHSIEPICRFHSFVRFWIPSGLFYAMEMSTLLRIWKLNYTRTHHLLIRGTDPMTEHWCCWWCSRTTYKYCAGMCCWKPSKWCSSTARLISLTVQVRQTKMSKCSFTPWKCWHALLGIRKLNWAHTYNLFIWGTDTVTVY